MTTSISSASGLLSLLEESQSEVQIYALKELNNILDQFWVEISDSIGKIEILYESEGFEQRQLAALVASKVYFHLGEFEESLSFALGAKELFDLSEKSLYVETIIAQAIQKYISLRQEAYADPKSAPTIDIRLKSVVEKMFNRCIQEKEYKQAIGIAIESHRLDILDTVVSVGDAQELLQYVLNIALTLVRHIQYRDEVLTKLVDMFLHLPNPDYLSVSQCYVYLNKSIESSKLIKKLITGEPSEANILTAYQIAFDLRDSATQHFINQLLNDFIGDHGEELKDFSDIDSIPVDDYVTRVRYILTGELGTRLYLEFLSRHNHVDLTILRNTKHSMDSRNSLCHSALSFANAFMNCGTTSDQFLRMNLEWLSRATNWSKFTATAALGVIHKGNIQSSMKILTPYLPQEGSNGSPYSEGGALLGLGFIHSNHGSGVLPYLLESLKSAKVEVIQHGAALGLGVAGIATDDEDIYEALKGVLFTDSAVAGQAAGLSMGLIMLGTGYTHVINEMLQYAHETQHEKIIMGLSVGISLINYGLQEKADPTIDQLCSDKDHLLRYGGMYTIAMAYCGTGDNKMIRRLLHVAVSDVSDDVRRAAVTALGFILFKTPEQVPRVVQLLSESYNPHVRYGATLALGISCAGTGLAEAIEILEPMTKDPMDYVRQGALIALAMVLIQQTDVSNHKVGVTRKLYESILSDKHEDLMAKFGASLGQGIIDAGGRNLTISLQSQLGCTNMPAIVGMALFTQFWFWFPMAHFISLAFKPTTIIGIDQSLKVPEFVFKSNARPSLFAYPPKFKAPTASVVEKAATAVLSTTAKAKARAKKREKSQDIDAMDVDEKTDNATVEEPKSVKSKKEEKEQTSLSDQTSETVPNMHRVLPFQIQHVQFLDTSRYQPIKQPVGGFIMLSDKKPHKAPRYIYPKPPSEKKEDKKAAAATSEATSTSAQPAAPAPSTTTQEQSGNAE